MNSLKKVYQFVLYYFVLFPFTLFICGPLLILGYITRMYAFNGWLQHVWGWCFFLVGLQKLRIEGSPETLHEDKAYVVIANHSSMIDIPLIAALITRPASWVLKDSLLKFPFLGWFFRMGGGIPLPRTNARTSNQRLSVTIEKVRQQMNPHILIFPEGTRSPSGKIADFKRGFVKIVKNYRMDIVPVTIVGGHNFIPVGKLLPNPRAEISAYVHKPVPWEEIAALDEKEAAAKMKDLIASKLPF